MAFTSSSDSGWVGTAGTLPWMSPPKSGLSPLSDIPWPCQHPCVLPSPCPAVPTPALTAPVGCRRQRGHGDTPHNVPPPMSLPSAHPQHSSTLWCPPHAPMCAHCTLTKMQMHVCAHACMCTLTVLARQFAQASRCIQTCSHTQTCRQALVCLQAPTEAQMCSCMHTQMHARCSTQGHTNAHVCTHM